MTNSRIFRVPVFAGVCLVFSVLLVDLAQGGESPAPESERPPDETQFVGLREAEPWRKTWGTQLLENQNVDGSRKPEGNFGKGAMSSSAAGLDAEIYHVCLNTLSLEAMLPVSPRRRTGEVAE